jgi:hypothetical protein
MREQNRTKKHICFFFALTSFLSALPNIAVSENLHGFGHNPLVEEAICRRGSIAIPSDVPPLSMSSVMQAPAAKGAVGSGGGGGVVGNSSSNNSNRNGSKMHNDDGGRSNHNPHNNQWVVGSGYYSAANDKSRSMSCGPATARAILDVLNRERAGSLPSGGPAAAGTIDFAASSDSDVTAEVVMLRRQVQPGFQRRERPPTEYEIPTDEEDGEGSSSSVSSSASSIPR